MTDEGQTPILRRLRETRAGRRDQLRWPTALGLAAQSNVVAERHGGRSDEFEDRLSAPRKRVAELESKQ